MKTFTNYDQAKTYARQLAAQGGPDAGIEKTRELGQIIYNVKYLPSPENSYGHELRMERVRKGD